MVLRMPVQNLSLRCIGSSATKLIQFCQQSSVIIFLLSSQKIKLIINEHKQIIIKFFSIINQSINKQKTVMKSQSNLTLNYHNTAECTENSFLPASNNTSESEDMKKLGKCTEGYQKDSVSVRPFSYCGFGNEDEGIEEFSNDYRLDQTYTPRMMNRRTINRFSFTDRNIEILNNRKSRRECIEFAYIKKIWQQEQSNEQMCSDQRVDSLDKKVCQIRYHIEQLMRNQEQGLAEIIMNSKEYQSLKMQKQRLEEQLEIQKQKWQNQIEKLTDEIIILRDGNANYTKTLNQLEQLEWSKAERMQEELQELKQKIDELTLEIMHRKTEVSQQFLPQQQIQGLNMENAINKVKEMEAMFIDGLQEKMREIQAAVDIIVKGGDCYVDGKENEEEVEVRSTDLGRSECEMPEEDNSEQKEDKVWLTWENKITRT